MSAAVDAGRAIVLGGAEYPIPELGPEHLAYAYDLAMVGDAATMRRSHMRVYAAAIAMVGIPRIVRRTGRLEDHGSDVLRFGGHALGILVAHGATADEVRAAGRSCCDRICDLLPTETEVQAAEGNSDATPAV